MLRHRIQSTSRPRTLLRAMIVCTAMSAIVAASAHADGSVTEHLVGNTAPNPAPEPFTWPSDHAGMVATLAVG